MHILVCRYAFFLLLLGYGDGNDALNSVELHRCGLMLVWKWHFCKQRFCAKNPYHSRSIAHILQLVIRNSETLEHSPERRFLHTRWFAVFIGDSSRNAVPSVEAGNCCDICKRRVANAFMKLNMSCPFWECSNPVATNIFLILDGKSPEVIRAKKLADIWSQQPTSPFSFEVALLLTWL